MPGPGLGTIEHVARPHTDFRRVYATLLDRWLAFDSRPILGRQFEPLELFS